MPSCQGHLIEYFDKKKIKFALVEKETETKLYLTNSNGKKIKISRNSLFTIHSPASLEDLTDQIIKTVAQINTIRPEINMELLWEDVAAGKKKYTIKELTNEYFGKITSLHKSALLRKILKQKIFFQYKNACLIPRTRDEVNKEKNKLQKKKELEALKKKEQQWLAEVLESTGNIRVPEEMQQAVKNIDQYLFQKKSSDTVSLLGQIKGERSTTEAAVEFLKKTGRLDPETDSFLVSFGIRTGFRKSVIEKAERISCFQNDPVYRDIAAEEALAIDDSDATEIDDAVTVSYQNEHLSVGIHIADLSYFINVDDAIDREACNRTMSLYLPDRSVPMVPARISSNVASLNQDQVRPCLSLLAEFDNKGQLVQSSFALTKIKIKHCLTYDKVDNYLKQTSKNKLSTTLKDLKNITDRLYSKRHAKGAVNINRPEIKIKKKSNEITYNIINMNSPARQMVAELMILYNVQAAAFAFDNSIPVIYRCQDQPEEKLDRSKLTGSYNPIAVDNALKKLKPSKITLYPHPHACLAVDKYIQM
ncbi:MAG TPA: ribonuclease catalytic domain-containing protein, partial [Spirochaetota bacterium]|nr:ribonuclease catalytic domain-containing protein [Spirochaetota bacterium]